MGFNDFSKLISINKRNTENDTDDKMLNITNGKMTKYDCLIKINMNSIVLISVYYVNNTKTFLQSQILKY